MLTRMRIQVEYYPRKEISKYTMYHIPMAYSIRFFKLSLLEVLNLSKINRVYYLPLTFPRPYNGSMTQLCPKYWPP